MSGSLYVIVQLTHPKLSKTLLFVDSSSVRIAGGEGNSTIEVNMPHTTGPSLIRWLLILLRVTRYDDVCLCLQNLSVWFMLQSRFRMISSSKRRMSWHPCPCGWSQQSICLVLPNETQWNQDSAATSPLSERGDLTRPIVLRTNRQSSPRCFANREWMLL